VRLAGASLVVLAAACGAGETPPPSRTQAPAATAPGRTLAEPPPIVLITIDTLRRDHVGAYGYFRDTTPAIDAFIAQSVMFENALAPMATTLPSHLSILTGLSPLRHGVTSNLASLDSPFASFEGCRSIAELLLEDGYTTAAVVSGRTLDEATGVGVGFSSFDAPEADERSAQETAERAIAWLDRRRHDRFFLWVHFWGPHEPNLPPSPYDAWFESDGALEALLDERGVDPSAIAGRFSLGTLARNLYPEHIEAVRARELSELPEPDRETFRRLYNRYDGEVRYTDEWVGRLLAALEQKGLFERAIVALAADHGQSLGQHGWLDHGEITQENLSVPLAVHFPAGVVEQPARVAGLVSLVDLMPTVLGRVRARASERFAAQAEGLDALAAGFRRDVALGVRTGRERRGFEGTTELAVVTERWKLVLRDGEKKSLYDLRTDPGEQVDLSARRADVVERLSRSLDSITRPVRERGSRSADPAEREALRKSLERLGYVGDE
jgi:arylsulfatase A-like enzyme